ncbi:hypothetical protein ACFQXA_23620 [Nocardiopsis composta]
MSRLPSSHRTLVHPDYGMFQIFTEERGSTTPRSPFPGRSRSAPVSTPSTSAACRTTSTSLWSCSRGTPNRPPRTAGTATERSRSGRPAGSSASARSPPAG